jgi:hypothetical protein
MMGFATSMGDMEKCPFEGAPGLFVSPDGKYLLYVQLDEARNSLMMAENFSENPQPYDECGRMADFFARTFPATRTPAARTDDAGLTLAWCSAPEACG